MTEYSPHRKFDRYELRLDGRCIAAGNIVSRKCLVTEISRAGASMYLLTNEKLTTGQSVMVIIDMPDKRASINAIVKLAWFKTLDGNAEYNYLTGGRIVFIKNEDRELLLNYAYRQLIEQEKNE